MRNVWRWLNVTRELADGKMLVLNSWTKCRRPDPGKKGLAGNKRHST